MEKKKSLFHILLTAALTCVLSVVLLAALLWAAAWLRLPAEESAAVSSAGVSPGVAFLNRFGTQKSDALAELAHVRKAYRLGEDVLVAPEPDAACYGTAYTAQEVEAVIADAALLLGDQTLAWTPDIRFVPAYGVRYYRDDSILVLAWVEWRNRCNVTFAEVVVSDGSQFRRKLASDKYGQGVLLFPTEMARRCNAVLAVSGDFYRFRPIGVCVYQRQVRRALGDKMDTCFVDSRGDMHFAYAGELADEAAVQRYVDENDILFSLSFGPVLVDGGVNVAPKRYYLGEVWQEYSRTALGQIGERHYLAMHLGLGLINDAAKLMLERGCVKAYALDGGQSGTIVLDGNRISSSRYRNQRSQSDIIYFATGIPADEGG